MADYNNVLPTIIQETTDQHDRHDDQMKTSHKPTKYTLFPLCQPLDVSLISTASNTFYLVLSSLRPHIKFSFSRELRAPAWSSRSCLLCASIFWLTLWRSSMNSSVVELFCSSFSSAVACVFSLSFWWFFGLPPGRKRSAAKHQTSPKKYIELQNKQGFLLAISPRPQLRWRHWKTERSPVILDLRLRKALTKKWRDYQGVIVFGKHQFQNVSRPHLKVMSMFSNCSGWKGIFVKLHYLTDLCSEIKVRLRFQENR